MVMVSTNESAAPEGVEELADALARGRVTAGELACSYVVRATQRTAGPRWNQGPWRPKPLDCSSAWPDAQTIAHTRLVRLDSLAARALAGWASEARPAEVLFRVPSADEVLALQARGRRCVSLLPAGVATPQHADGLAFAVHDLCHLEKFVDAEHYEGQVGFFDAALTARAHPRMIALEQELDAAWQIDRDRVLADMNGSCIFLIAALKMKLKMAVRRLVALQANAPPPGVGPLAPAELAAFDERLDSLLDAFDLAGSEREAAKLVSTRHDAQRAAEHLASHFEARGARILERV